MTLEERTEKNTLCCYVKTPVGGICIEEEGGAITSLYICRDPMKLSEECPDALLREAKKQLQEYFAGDRRKFTLPLRPAGTPFQQKVWDALRRIPYGETCSYGEIAVQIGNPKACRAVGGANNKNPIMILIPCHRVVGADGSLVGFGGGLPVKEFLLALEKSKS